VVRQVTAKNRYARALAAVTAWCRGNRHRSIPDQRAHLTAMMRGHYAYYGITGNFRRIRWDEYLGTRRDRRSRFQWSRFAALLKRHPLPAARIIHRYTAAYVQIGTRCWRLLGPAAGAFGAVTALQLAERSFGAWPNGKKVACISYVSNRKGPNENESGQKTVQSLRGYFVCFLLGSCFLQKRESD
jgi:hypothetical protein